MSAKKKNPLKDLSAFLAHQDESSQIAAPNSVDDHDEFMDQKPSQVASVNRPEKVKIAEDISSEVVQTMLTQLIEKHPSDFREVLGEIILKTIESLPDQQPADAMLINTVLYLNNQENWEKAVKSYWDSRY